MGAETIPVRYNKDETHSGVIDETWYDTLTAALSENLVPRADGVPQTLSATLGSATYPFRRLQEASGGFRPGDFKSRHSYGGILPVSDGWMLCDGRQITKATYDAEHGAGSWDAHIVGTPFEDKYLPNFVGKYSRGKAATNQNGDVALTSVGNQGNIKSLLHNHQYNKIPSDGFDCSYDSNGAERALTYQVKSWTRSFLFSSAYMPNAFTDSRLSAVQSVQPESLEVLIYMRII